jgi:hypothetical protein
MNRIRSNSARRARCRFEDLLRQLSHRIGHLNSPVIGILGRKMPRGIPSQQSRIPQPYVSIDRPASARRKTSLNNAASSAGPVIKPSPLRRLHADHAPIMLRLTWAIADVGAMLPTRGRGRCLGLDAGSGRNPAR